MLWLAIRDIEDKRAASGRRRKAYPRERRAPARLVEGAVIQGLRQAVDAPALHYPDRIGSYIN